MDRSLLPVAHGPSVWTGPAMLAARDAWTFRFSAAEVGEIEAGVAHALDAGWPIPELTSARFPLPRLGPRLSAWRDEVLDGRGFVLLRGLPVDRWTVQQSAVAFYGIGTHLGAARPQNGKGHVLGHVQDLGLRSDDPNVRIYQTRERQTFHTDSCDIVGLLCLQAARRGGHSLLVSTGAIWNAMREQAPELAALLTEPMATDRRGEVPAGARPYFSIPVFNWHEGRLSAIYQRQYIDSAQRFDDAPRLTPAHARALDLLDALANDPSLNFEMVLEPGDVQLVHNHVLLHDRTAFEDWPEPDRSRHLLRLWLAPETARPLPPVFAERYGSIVPGRRGGVEVPGMRLTAPLHAE